jgi:hypothetical protein
MRHLKSRPADVKERHQTGLATLLACGLGPEASLEAPRHDAAACGLDDRGVVDLDQLARLRHEGQPEPGGEAGHCEGAQSIASCEMDEGIVRARPPDDEDPPNAVHDALLRHRLIAALHVLRPTGAHDRPEVAFLAADSATLYADCRGHNANARSGARLA